MSILPDIDLIIPGLRHRGLTHSLIIQTIAFIPIFLYYKKQAAPPYVAIIQHSLIGDYITNGGVQIFSPILSKSFVIGIPLRSIENIIIESSSFLLAAILMILTKDLPKLFKPEKKNIFLIVPSGAILLSAIMPLSVAAPIELLVPHIFLLGLFSLSLLGTFSAILATMNKTH